MTMTDSVRGLREIPPWNARALGWPRPKIVLAVVAVLLGIVFPFIAPDRSWLSVATLAMVWVTLGQSWNLLLGFGGLWNFGQLALYAVGAYVAALLSIHLPISPWLTLPLGGLCAGAIALLLSIPILRLRGIYVSLLTFGFAEVVRLLIIADQSGVTGGSYGISGFAGFGFTGPDAMRYEYWIVFAVAVLTTLVILFIVRSPLGNGMIAMRDNPALAAARGISQRTYQMLIFAISGFIAGVAGALYAHVFKVASPTLMGLVPMTLIVTMLVVGSLGTIMGPIIGTLLISFVQMQLQDAPEVRMAALGIVLLAVILLMPRGLVPFFSHWWNAFQSWMNHKEDDEEDIADREEGDGDRNTTTEAAAGHGDSAGEVSAREN